MCFPSVSAPEAAPPPTPAPKPLAKAVVSGATIKKQKAKGKPSNSLFIPRTNLNLPG